jgi:Flp pilus assembly protein TadD
VDGSTVRSRPAEAPTGIPWQIRPMHDGHPGDSDGRAPGDGEDAYDLLQRGLGLLSRRHHAQAAIVLERADRLEPRRGSILEPLGRAYFMSGQLERSVETFRLLLEVDPSNHYAHYALGRTFIRLGRRDEGRTHLRLAVALKPDSRLYRGGLERLAPDRAP